MFTQLTYSDIMNLERQVIVLSTEEYRKVFAKKLRYYMDINHKTQMDLMNDLGFSSATVSNWCTGKKLPRMDKMEILAEYFGIEKSDLYEDKSIPSNAISNVPTGLRPVLGKIPAGEPALAINDIIGYEPVSVPDPDSTFWLRVTGDSMIGAGIMSGDYVLIRQQSWAENGQIVACRVNGDEATLKRYSKQGDMILLSPENSSYDPRIIPLKEFETGDAGIIGVAIEFKRKLV